MVCIYCGKKTDVINSRPQKRLGTTWRRRQCQTCGTIFTSIETPDLAASVRVVQKDGKRVPFERDILYISIVKVLGHRTDAVSAATSLTATIIAKLLSEARSALIERHSVIYVTQSTLQAFDATAATLYAAYHADIDRH